MKVLCDLIIKTVCYCYSIVVCALQTITTTTTITTTIMGNECSLDDRYGIYNNTKQIMNSEQRNFIIDCLKNDNEIISKINVKHVNELIDALDYNEYGVGEYIFKEGDNGDKLYFLEYGTIDIITACGKDCNTVKKGQIFGQFGFFNNKVRSSSAISIKRCGVYSIDIKQWNAKTLNEQCCSESKSSSKDDSNRHTNTHASTTNVDNIKVLHNPYGVFIWYADISKLSGINTASTQYLLNLLSVKEKEKVMKFYFDDDKKRSLLSVYLQKALVRHFLKIDSNSFVIERTAENKPYAKGEQDIGSWNYNVSHHGNYVCIASHPSLIVGADLMDLNTKHSHPTAADFFKMFSDQLLPSELNEVIKCPQEEDQFTMFFVLWSLKESFVKAIGLGLGYNLHDIEFSINFEKKDYDLKLKQSRKTDLADDENWLRGSAKAKIKGVHRTDWNFDFCSLDSNHVMSIARGPLQDVIPSYSQCAWADDKKPRNKGNSESIEDFKQDVIKLVKAPLPVPSKKSIEQLLTSQQYQKFVDIKNV